MTYTAYDKTNVTKQEKIFTARFVDALRKDITSAKHGTQINYQVLSATIYLLENRHLSPQLSLEQIVRGALNMALALEDYNYSVLRRNKVAVEEHARFTEQVIRWFGNYNEQLKNKNLDLFAMAIPVIERASKGPLFMMTDCVQETIDLYFEYTKQFEQTFETKRQLLSNLKLSRTANKFSFEIFTPEINKFKDVNQFFENMLENLFKRIDDLSKNPNKHKKSIEEAVKLHDALLAATTNYKGDKNKEAFIAHCTAAIEASKPILEKELGWGDYLVNLLKSIVNAVLSATNSVFKSNITLFAPNTAPIVSEVENMEEHLKDFNSSPSN